MRRIVIILAAAVLGFAACTVKELDNQIPENKDEAPVFRVTVEAQNAPTKASLNNLSIEWTADDQIRVFSAENPTGAKYRFLSETEGVAEFAIVEGESWTESSGPFWGAYPATATFADNALTFSIPATQTYTEGSFDPSAYPMAAYSTDLSLKFKNVCGVVKLNVYSTDSRTVSAVKLYDASGICGTVAVTMNTDGTINTIVPALTGTQITLSAASAVAVGASAANAKSFYAVLPVGAFASKITVALEDATGIGMQKTAGASAIERSQLLEMPAFNYVTAGDYAEVKESAGYANGPIKIGTKSGATLVKAVFDGKEVAAEDGVAVTSVNVTSDSNVSVTAYFYMNGKPGTVYSQALSVPVKNWYYEIGNLPSGIGNRSTFTHYPPVASSDGKYAYYGTHGGKAIFAVDIANKSLKWNTNANGIPNSASNAESVPYSVNPKTGEVYMLGNIGTAIDGSTNMTNALMVFDGETGNLNGYFCNGMSYSARNADNSSFSTKSAGIHNANGSGVAFSEDGNVVFAISSDDGTVIALDAHNLEFLGAQVIHSTSSYIGVRADLVYVYGSSNGLWIARYNPEATKGERMSLAHGNYGSGIACTYPNTFAIAPNDSYLYYTEASGRLGVQKCYDNVYERKDATIYGATLVICYSPLVDADGNVYITGSCSSGARVVKLTPGAGSVLWTWIVPNGGVNWPNGLNYCTGVLAADGNLYLRSREDSKIYKINCETGEGEVFAEPPAGAATSAVQAPLALTSNGYLLCGYSQGTSATAILAAKYIGAGPAKNAWAQFGGDACNSKNQRLLRSAE